MPYNGGQNTQDVGEQWLRTDNGGGDGGERWRRHQRKHQRREQSITRGGEGITVVYVTVTVAVVNGVVAFVVVYVPVDVFYVIITPPSSKI
ncbi:hypothetical protein F2Q70_00044710 [Brassica cretica]|uniref:Transmembrane protein n=1 Tax=Brassica cretica TaxID=69181 RepID=A0A8S9KNT5_BRACR|nr:hypothetical protein F2Q70_00044710 [Brassica cretica]KAF2607088.1 hypothetical protein F2Q68_00045663 [Brassica cretica]